MRNFYFLAILLLGSISVIAQSTITGTVLAKDSKESLPGVTILVKGTVHGTTTDLDGKFSLQATPNDTLILSFIGYKTLDFPINGMSSLNILLEEDTKQLEELVVVGYGVQKKSDVTGALVSLSSEDMQETHQQSIASIMQGRAAGVNVTSNSGSPGREPRITIRGVGSINGSSPLWIVDGVATNGGVAPQDIESMEVLKDASATAIYGTKGANGVILITTKSGSGKAGGNKSGNMNINYENRFSWGKMYKRLNLATAKQWAKLRSEAYSNAGLPVPPELNEPWGEGTDWQDAVTRTAASQNHYLSFSGNSEKINWFMSANYNDQEGIVQKSDAQSIALRLNSSGKVTKWLRIGENLSFNRTNTHLINEDDEWNAIMVEAISIDPLTKVKKEDGSWDGSKWNTVNNPVAHLDRTKDDSKDFTLGGNVFAELSFLKDFTFMTRLGYEQTYSNYYNWKPTFFVKTGEENSQTSVTRDFYEGRDWVFTNYLTWGQQYGLHSIKVMAGMESERDYGEWFGLTASDLMSEEAHLIYIDNAAGNLAASGYGLASDVTYLSYYGRVNYNFANKYFVTANFRRQSSSKFGPDYRWGNFPGFSLGWKISEEAFMDNADIVSLLKLRGGYGLAGNDMALKPYQFFSTSTSGQRYVIGNQIVDGVAFLYISNPELHWEERSTLNIGIDLGMWEDRLTFSGDFFIDKTNEMLFNPDLPGHVGTQEMPYTNVASMQNTGFEFIIGYKNSHKDFNYDLRLNFSHVSNKVTDLGSANYIPEVPFMQMGFLNRTEVGHPMASFYGYVTDGLFQNQAEVDAYTKPDGTPIQPNAAPGDIRYKADEEGILINDFLGSPFPDFSAGLNMNFQFKGFDLIVFFYGVYGNEIFNATKFYNFNSSIRYNVDASLMGRWLLEGDTDDPNMARLNLNDANNGLRSDRFIEDGSYLRLKTLQLSYHLPQKIFRNVDLNSLSVFVGGDNLFTLTKYTGFDPEVGQGYDNNPFDLGIDRARYPSPRTVYFGISLNF